LLSSLGMRRLGKGKFTNIRVLHLFITVGRFKCNYHSQPTFPTFPTVCQTKSNPQFWFSPFDHSSSLSGPFSRDPMQKAMLRPVLVKMCKDIQACGISNIGSPDRMLIDSRKILKLL
jgi:hypothetical protein